MSVHKALTKHVEKINSRVVYFQQLDAKRETYIEEALQKCLNGEAFTVAPINAITEEMNELAKQGVVPTRKIVTKEMVQEYAETLK
ncbi:DUF2533 family protein [Niallia sp. NCCP-28]|uniref:DUF2533 family protein n=1 Tax=Niallia sp. NCCP-28 TaxID=2934712 RepID=UPI00207F9E64|nr:DUF2533 family protein [Niallia sp. NCCP-28]GKU83058.1 hypothetical protein NCCP28_24540 [Niallia sp. NCCP-28]